MILNLQTALEALENNNTVTTLDLGGSNIGDKGAEALAKALKNNNTVTILNLWDNNIGVEGAKALSEALENNEIVTALYLAGNNIGDEGAKALTKSFNTVTTLDLGGSNIGDKGAEALAKALKNNKTVTTLYLGENNIGDEGAKALSEALENNNTVTILDLRENNIGVNLWGNNIYLKEIENLLKRNRKMKQVYLRKNTNINDIKMTLSFGLNRQKQEVSDDEIFYNNIRGGLAFHPFFSLEKDAINEVLTILFSDCPEKIEPFKESVKNNGGIFSLSGMKIENAEKAIKNLSSPPSISPETQSIICEPIKCTGCQIQ